MFHWTNLPNSVGVTSSRNQIAAKKKPGKTPNILFEKQYICSNTNVIATAKTAKKIIVGICKIRFNLENICNILCSRKIKYKLR